MNRYQDLINDIETLAKKAKRDPSDIKLLAVTKGMSLPTIDLLYSQGARVFAENRIPEALLKQAQAPKDCRWHFIGALQSNKVSKVIGRFFLIHSIDSFSLAKKISAASAKANVITSLLLQVNTSHELSKRGMSPNECLNDYLEIRNLPNINVLGLMTMAPNTNDETVIRNCFSDLRNLRDQLNQLDPSLSPIKELSMGMSSDYPIAIEEGATILRIGSLLFMD